MASGKPRDGNDGEKRPSEGGGADRRSRSTPEKAEGSAAEDSRAEARDMVASVGGLNRWLVRRASREDWEM